MIASLCLLINAVLFAKVYDDVPSAVFGIAFLGLGTAILSNHLEWTVFTLPLWFLAFYLKGKLNDHFRSFALLFGLLVLITTISAIFFGKDQVLLSL
jgi:hypothetical protein